MANSVKLRTKKTNNMDVSDQSVVLSQVLSINNGNAIKIVRTSLDPICAVTFELIKNPNDPSESKLASATINESDWGSETGKSILTWTEGAEGDNGSTADHINYFLTSSDTGIDGLYAVRVFVRGHSETQMFIQAISSIGITANSSGRYELELWFEGSAG